MRALATVLAFWALTSAAKSAEIPARFQGVWSVAAAGGAECKASDWKGIGRTDDDRLVSINAKAMIAFESGCDVKAAKTIAASSGYNRKVDGPTTLTLSCSGEGQTETTREVWDIISINGAEVLIVSDARRPRIGAYIRCRG